MRLVVESCILVATALASFSKSSLAATLDPTVGNNWYIPTSTISSNRARSDSNGVLPHYNYRTIGAENSPSSFLPTTANAARHQEVSNGVASDGKFYYQTVGEDGTKQLSQYQYYQYPPDGDSHTGFPTSANAEQRQEFLDPSNLLPLGGGGPPALGDFGADGADGGDGGGGSFLDNLPSIGGVTSGITGTASNIAQAIGLGGLGVAGGLIVLAIGGPLLAFAVIFPVAILVVAILGFPVLQLTLPPSDPNLARKFKVGIIESARKAREVLQSEECVERLSCGLTRKSRKLPYENWILEKMDNTKNVWANRVSASVKTGRAGDDCNRFKCTFAVKLREVYDAFLRK